MSRIDAIGIAEAGLCDAEMLWKLYCTPSNPHDYQFSVQVFALDIEQPEDLNI